MISIRCLLAALASSVLLGSCAEFAPAGIEGRWAAPGIELKAQAGSAELHLRCTAAAGLTRGLLPDSEGTIRFSTLVRSVCGGSYRVDFIGHLVGDTLLATVTQTFGAGTPVVQTYTMLAGGDPDFVPCFCAY